MVKLKKCADCGRYFKGEGDLCKRCGNQEESKFQKVKEFLLKNSKTTINKVHQKTNIEKKIILKFLKEGKLEAEGLDVKVEYECARCGRNITEGNYCYKCLQKIMNEIDHSFKKNKTKKKQTGKVHLKDRIENKV